MINVIGPINTLGYGYTTLNIVKQLSPDVAWWAIGQPEISTQEDYDIIKAAAQRCNTFDPDSACIRIWHQHDMSQFVGKGPHIGFPIFELDQFNDVEKHHLNSVDHLFVCSSWAKGVCLDNLKLPKDNIHVVPLGVDTNIFKPATTLQNNKTVFFNCGKWEYRKGHDILTHAFNAAFNESDPVELWLMCDNPFLKPEQTEAWKKLYRDTKLGYKIKFIPRVQTHQEVYNIMSQVDCGVFPARAEGWNLELLELMACGKQVIATDYSAHTEFCTGDNSLLVNMNSTEKAYDGVWFHGNQGRWASHNEDSLSQIVSHMRAVHSLKANNQDIINHNGISTARNFTWGNTGKAVQLHVQSIVQQNESR